MGGGGGSGGALTETIGFEVGLCFVLFVGSFGMFFGGGGVVLVGWGGFGGVGCGGVGGGVLVLGVATKNKPHTPTRHSTTPPLS